MRERYEKHVGQLSFVGGLLGSLISLNAVMRYASWAWFYSEPPLEGFFGWMVAKSDLLWMIMLIVIFVIGVLFGRSGGKTIKINPPVMVVLGIGFPIAISPGIILVVLSTLIS